MAIERWEHVVEHVHGQRWVTVTGINERGQETDVWGSGVNKTQAIFDAGFRHGRRVAKEIAEAAQ